MISINLWKNGNAPLQWRGSRNEFDICIELPSEWNELTRQELLIISKDLMHIEEKGYEAKANILTTLIALRAAGQKIRLPKFWKHNLSPEDAVLQGFDLINFLFDRIALTKQLLPEIKTGSNPLTGWVYGPCSGFDDLTCGEFEDAKLFFDLFKNDKEIKDLAMLSAVLWRPKVSGKRVRYKEYDAEKKLAAFLKLSPELLMSNFFWFAGCLLTLPELFPQTFSSGSGPEDLSAFTKCIHAGAGPKNGTRAQVRELLLKEFFFDMEQEAIHINEMEKENH